jgi:hypothetical protein
MVSGTRTSYLVAIGLFWAQACALSLAHGDGGSLPGRAGCPNALEGALRTLNSLTVTPAYRVPRISLPAIIPPHPDAKRFAAQFPHDLAELSNPQTRVWFPEIMPGRPRPDYLIKAYDESTGRVLVTRKHIEPVVYQGAETGFANFPGVKAEDMVPGRMVVDAAHIPYEVISYNEHGSKIAYLKRTEDTPMDWGSFQALVQDGAVVPVRSRTPSVDRTEVLTPTLSWRNIVAHTFKDSKIIPKVGRAGIKRLWSERSMIAFDRVSSEIPFTEISQLATQEFPLDAHVDLKVGEQIESYDMKNPVRREEFKVRIQRLSENEGRWPGNSPLALNGVSITIPGQLPRALSKIEILPSPGDVRPRAWKWVDTLPSPGHRIRYQIGKGPSARTLTLEYPDQGSHLKNQHLEKDAEKLFAQIPKGQENAQGYVVINNQVCNYANAAANAEQRVRDGGTFNQTQFYNYRNSPMPGQISRLIDTFYHELGHHVAMNEWGDYVPRQDWVHAMVEDGHFVSGYSQKAIEEDLAETFKAYLKSDAGRLDPLLREKFANRFKILDRIQGTSEAQVKLAQEFDRALQRYRFGLVTTAGVASAAGAAYLIFKKNEP